jgi:hypothetical protein
MASLEQRDLDAIKRNFGWKRQEDEREQAQAHEEAWPADHGTKLARLFEEVLEPGLGVWGQFTIS